MAGPPRTRWGLAGTRLFPECKVTDLRAPEARIPPCRVGWNGGAKCLNALCESRVIRLFSADATHFGSSPLELHLDGPRCRIGDLVSILFPSEPGAREFHAYFALAWGEPLPANLAKHRPTAGTSAARVLAALRQGSTATPGSATPPAAPST